MKISKVIIVINQGKAHARNTARILKGVLDSEKVSQQWLESLAPEKDIRGKIQKKPTPSADLILACGGDGTLLQTAHRFRGSGIPILGINIGYMGFITSVEGQHIRKEMHRILDAEFVVSERTALDLTVHDHKVKTVTGWALNDAVITRGANP